jgi:hypothetical protein
VFAGLINQAKSAASDLALKYVARASVAVPFVIAAGFALAAITVTLVERFGQVTAYWLVAGGLAAVGIVAALAVSIKEEEEAKAEQVAEESDTQEVVSDAAAQAIAQTPIALLGALMTTPGGATPALGVARLLGRNFPLVLLLVMTVLAEQPAANGRGRGHCADAERLRRDAELICRTDGAAMFTAALPDACPGPMLKEMRRESPAPIS